VAPRLGFGLPLSGSWATPERMRYVARRAEDLGYDALWTFQRLLHPATGDWGPMYRSVQDPIVSLAYAAAVTERIRLGLAIVNVPFYAPIVLAKQLTTLDAVSAGRVADGWISSSRQDLTSITESIEVVREAAREAGRDPAALRFVVRGVVRLDPEPGAREPGESDRRPLTGTADQIRADLDDLARRGVTEVFLDLNFDPRVGSPAADPVQSLRLADEVLDTFAPAGSAG